MAWHAETIETNHDFVTTAIYRNSSESKFTEYHNITFGTQGNLLADSHVSDGQAVPDQVAPFNVYAGRLDSSNEVFGANTVVADPPQVIKYSNGTYLLPMKLEPVIKLKKRVKKWPGKIPVRLDAEMHMHTSTAITTQEADFEVDVGKLLANAIILFTPISQSGEYSRRVIMSFAGILKPFVENQHFVKFSMTVLHKNHPDDGYDSLTYTAGITVRSSLVNWYMRPVDNDLVEAERCYQASLPEPQTGKSPPPKKRGRFSRFLKLLSSRKTHN